MGFPCALLLLWVLTNIVSANPVPHDSDRPLSCKRTKVAVLGAGVAGIAAAVGGPTLGQNKTEFPSKH